MIFFTVVMIVFVFFKFASFLIGYWCTVLFVFIVNVFFIDN